MFLHVCLLVCLFYHVRIDGVMLVLKGTHALSFEASLKHMKEVPQDEYTALNILDCTKDL